MGIQIPNDCLSAIDQFPTNIDQEQRLFEVGIPASCLLRPLNAELDRLEAKNEKGTNFSSNSRVLKKQKRVFKS